MRRYDVVIVGGGVIGLSIAYHLKSLYPRLDVAVYESKYVGYGASTRNASHIRIHFWSEQNFIFALKSWRMMLNFASKLKWNPVLYLGGYLWLIYDEEILRAYEDANRRIWGRYGYPVEILDRGEVKRRYPYLNTSGLHAGILGREDGKIHHDYVTYGYAVNFTKMGGEIYEYTPVDGLKLRDDSVEGVIVGGRIVECENVVIAAGAWSKHILSGIGVDLPLTPTRKELCVLEPTSFFIEPLLIDMRRDSEGLYLCQTPRGEIMGSVDYPHITGSYEFNNTIKYLSVFSRKAIRLVPMLRNLRFLRIWSGDYNVTPDNSHIMGRRDDWPSGLYVATGYSGHGFMMAPYTGYTMARLIVEDYLIDDVKPFLPDRFERDLLIEERMVIG